MAKRKFILNDFSGGENKGPEERLGPNEASVLQGFSHTDGTLRSSSGRTAYKSTVPAVCNWFGQHVVSGTTYDVTTTYQGAWLYTGGTPDLRPIASGKLIGGTSWNDSMYFTGYSSAGGANAQPLVRWDGFFYITGTVVCTGNTTVTGTGTADFVGCAKGDALFINEEGIQWHGPYRIVNIATTGDGVLTIDQNGPITANFVVHDNVQFIVTRYHNVGIAPLSTWTGEATSTASGTNEVQTIRFDADSGSWDMYLPGFGVFFDGAPVATWTFNQDSSYIQTWMNLILGTAGGITVTHTGSLTGDRTYTITFGGSTQLNGSNIPQLECDNRGLLKKGADLAAIAVNTTTPGGGYNVAPASEVWNDYAWGNFYNFALVLKNSSLGTESGATYLTQYTQSLVRCGQRVTITGYNVSPNTGSGWQADQLVVYRESVPGSGVYYSCKTVARDQAGFTFPASIIVDGSETMGTTALTETRSQPPANIYALQEYNGHLYAIGECYLNTAGDTWGSTGQPHLMFFSAYGNPEEWSTDEWTPAAVADPLQGGYVRFGQVTNPLMQMSIEGSSSVADVNAGLLVVTKRGACHRWRGTTHDNFNLQTGCFMSSCISYFSGVRSDDLIGWWSSEGPVVKANNQSNAVMPIYAKKFPIDSSPFSAPYTSTLPTYAGIVGTKWKEFFVWSYPTNTGDGSNTLTLAYHLPSGTFKTWEHASNAVGARNFFVTPFTEYLVYIDNSNAIWRLESKTSTSTYWTGTTGVACKYKSGFFSTDDFWEKEKLTDFEFCFNKPSAQQTVTWTIYDAETASSLKSGTFTVPTGSGRYYVRANTGGIRARQYQIELLGTFTATVVLYGIRAVSVGGGE